MTVHSLQRRTDTGTVLSTGRGPDRLRARVRHPRPEADVDLERRVSLFLSQRGTARKGDLKVQAESGTVTLRGIVPSLQAKRFCLECCRHVAGVIKIVDQLEVEEANIGSEGRRSYRRKPR